MIGKKIKILSVILCFTLLMSGCVSTSNSDTSSSQKKIVYVVEDDEIIYYGNNDNSQNDSQNNSQNSNMSEGSSVDDSEEEYKPISSGEWKQERFYLSSCTGPSSLAGLTSFKEAGFNLCEWAMEADETYFTAIANANKIGGIYCLPSNHFRTSMTGGNLVFNENSIRNAVYEYAKVDPNRQLIGYTVWDEPILSDEFFSQANRMIKYLNKYDPNSLKYINLLPSYGIYTWDSDKVDSAFGANGYESYVESFINGINPQIIALDYYPYLMGTYGDTGDWFRDMGWFRKMSLKYNKPFWFYYQIEQVGGVGLKPTNDQIRYQMYVALAYNAKALTGWNQDAVRADGTKTEYFEETKSRNAEIMPVGTYLLDKTTKAIYHTGAAGNYTEKFYLDKLEDSDLIASAPSRVIMSVFEDGKTNTKYLLVVNKNTENAISGTIKLKSSKSISMFNRKTSGEDYITSGNSIQVNINAGGGEIYILK